MQFFFFVNTCDNNSVQKTSTRQFYRKTEKSTKTLTSTLNPAIFVLLPGEIFIRKEQNPMNIAIDSTDTKEQLRAMLALDFFLHLSEDEQNCVIAFLKSLS